MLQHFVVFAQLQLALAVVEHQRRDQAFQLQPAILPRLLLSQGVPVDGSGLWLFPPRHSWPTGESFAEETQAGMTGGSQVLLTLAWRFLRQMTASWYLAAACPNSLRRTRRLPSLCRMGTAASFSSLLMAQVSRLYAEGSSTCMGSRR